MRLSNTILIGIAFSMILPGVSYAASQTFTSSGTFTVPAGVTSLTATLIGGGGGGGGTEGRGDNRAGGGGGSGGYSVGTYTVTPGSVITVTVGQGGAPGTFAFNYTYTCAEWITDDAGNTWCASYSSATPNYMCSTAGSTGTRDGAAGSNSSISSVDGTVTATGGRGGTGSGSTDPYNSTGGDNCGGLPGAGGTPSGVSGTPFNPSPDSSDSVNYCPRNNYTPHLGGVLPSPYSSYGKGGDSNGNPGYAICAAPGGTGRVILDWTTPTVGTVNVSSNISSSWTITGPTTITGSGTSQSSPSQPTGTYTITWGTVSGYTKPATQSLTLTSGSTITFTGTYVASSLPPEPTFNATCTLQGNGTYSVALTWNAVTPVTNYPVRLRGPSHATASSPSYPIGLSGTTDVIGWGVVGDAPTSSGLTFTGLTTAGSYEYWGHAWSSTNGWSTNTIKTVSCGAAAPTSCTLPWGGTIASGSSVTAYQSASVTSPSTCVSETRTCSNGVLSGTYTNQSCSVTASGPTGNISAPNCTIAAGASTCSTTVTWSTDGVTSAQAFQNGTSFSTSLSGSQTRTVGNTSSTFTLFDRTPSPDVQLDSDLARGTCASGSGWNGTYCELGYLPDLTAGTITPTTASIGQSTTLVATVSNIGPLTTSSNFRNFIQVATAADGGGTISDLSDVGMNTLAAGASATTQRNYTFSSAGTYSARACADKRNRNDAGQIDEGANEGNNCGGWANIVVTGASCTATTISNCSLSATGSGGTSGSCAAGYGGSCTYTCNNGTWSQNSNSCAAIPTVTLTASPTSINPGQTSRLSWTSTGATSCIFADETTTRGTSSSRNVSPAVTSTYSITCTGAGGTSAPATATVTVLTPTLSISAVPNRVARGSSSTITWNATSVRSCSITKNGAAWRSGNANGSNIYTGSAVETINSQTIYVMSCRDVNGNPYSATATVIVNIAPDFQEF